MCTQLVVRFLALLQIFTGVVTAWPWPTKEPPVCVVGAGPAGLTAAAYLEKKGYETVVFEKQPQVGGKSQAVYEK